MKIALVAVEPVVEPMMHKPAVMDEAVVRATLAMSPATHGHCAHPGPAGQCEGGQQQ
ncbi:MAG: hypothetical protein ACREXN_00575 [Polaromonas sp.]